jgi:hypothetical protein
MGFIELFLPKPAPRVQAVLVNPYYFMLGHALGSYFWVVLVLAQKARPIFLELMRPKIERFVYIDLDAPRLKDLYILILTWVSLDYH